MTYRDAGMTIAAPMARRTFTGLTVELSGARADV
jgi:hypothetical protein